MSETCAMLGTFAFFAILFLIGLHLKRAERLSRERKSAVESATTADARNIEAELLTEILKTLGEELGCGPNAYEIRQAIAKLKAHA